MIQVAISLGSNLGNRSQHIEYALQALAHDLSDFIASSIFDTQAVEVATAQPNYLNAAVVGRTPLSPRALLDRLMQIEKERGRERPFPMAPRSLDLDLILYGDQVIDEEELTVPHPRFSRRNFVLAPLASIAPDLVDPLSGLTVRELFERLESYS